MGTPFRGNHWRTIYIRLPIFHLDAGERMGNSNNENEIDSSPGKTYPICIAGDLSMSSQLMEFEAKALKLPPTDRATLAERLIASLDNLNEQQNEQLWIDEADLRYREYKSGKITARSAADVLSDARDAIK